MSRDLDAVAGRRAHRFTATLVFISEVGGRRTTLPLCEFRVVIVRASSEAEARALVMAHGRAEAHVYQNVRSVDVRWSFAGLLSLQELIGSIDEDVVDVSSRYERRKPALPRFFVAVGARSG